MNIEKQLADALRAVIDTAPGGVRANEADNIAAIRCSILAIATYDAQQADPIDVLAVLQRQADIARSYGNDERADAIDQVRAAIAKLVEAAAAVAGPQVGINPRDRKLHALRDALANVSGGA